MIIFQFFKARKYFDIDKFLKQYLLKKRYWKWVLFIYNQVQQFFSSAFTRHLLHLKQIPNPLSSCSGMSGIGIFSLKNILEKNVTTRKKEFFNTSIRMCVCLQKNFNAIIVCLNCTLSAFVLLVRKLFYHLIF